ncbi:MAG: aminopeptidase P family protein [Gammaproteobacteria bacterium]|nr:aminopeptidase P family protein [Gammaproteobacteria bacterium]
MNTGIPMLAPLQPQFANRLAAFRQAMQQANQQAALIFGAENLRYLVNYAGEAACVVLTQNSMALITDYRFEAQARQECAQAQQGCRVICRDRDQQRLGEALALELAAQQATQLWYEAESISVQQWQQIQQDLSTVHCTACPPELSSLRMVKDDWEVAQIQQAAQIADEALAQVLPLLQPGISEADFATELEYRLKKLGAEALSFATIVGFGARSALPHALPTSQRLQKGDLVLIDFGAVVNGYRSDMTRSYVAGKPDLLQLQLFQAVQQAQQAALKAVKAGVSASALFAISDQVLQHSQFGRYAGPGLGHGVGLQLHEQPFLSPGNQLKLPVGAVVTIEPGVYLPNYGGLRLEDDVLVTAHGYVQLTKAPQQFALDC